LLIDIKTDNLRILITGGAGFIGGCLVRKLLNTSNAIIFNLDKLSYASDLSGIKNTSNITNHTLIKADLNNYGETLSAVLKADPDIIFHLAAESHVDRSIENARPFIESNVLGTFNLLESAKLHWNKMELSRKERFRFLHVSTDEVFGSLEEEGQFSEKSPYNPRSPYSASKAASDHLCNAWFHTFNFPVIKTNCSNNFGPFQFPEKLIPLIIIKALNNLPIPIYGDGKNVRDWLFVEDHVDALITSVTKGKVGRTYCIGANNERSNLEIAESICKLFDENFPKKQSHLDLIKFVKDRPGHDKRYAINSELITKELGWEAKHDFNKALSKTLEWYLANKEWYKNIQQRSGYQGQRIGLG
tara:strand:+ start:172 stop:1248 length:1077 start_codon:yes stop_codon:yes gene_type:complete